MKILLVPLLAFTLGIADARDLTSSLEDLWNKFEAAEKSDRPQTALAVLDTIIETSRQSRSSWDFYEAWKKKVSLGQSVNWKLRPQLLASCDSAFDAYGEPIIELVRGRMDFNAVRNSAEVLEKSENRGFYSADNRFFAGVGGYDSLSEALSKSIANDMEFALWYLLAHGNPEQKAELRKYMESRLDYPQKAFVDFDAVSDKAEAALYNAPARKEYAAFEKRWTPSAAAMLATQRLLSLKMDTLCSVNSTTSAEFRQFRDLCGEFEKKRATFRGDEKLIAGKCGEVEYIIKRLDSKDVSVAADSSEITVFFRNLTDAQLTISENDEVIWSEDVHNTAGSYFALDSLVVPLPDLDDGDYSVKVSAGTYSSSCVMPRHSISAAVCRNSDGWAVFAALYDSGKPLETYDISLFNTKGDILVASSEAFRQTGGLSDMPSAVSDAIVSGPTRSQYIVVSFRDSGGILHSSGKLYLYPKDSYEDDPVSRMKAVIFKDCGIYRRGSVMHCKAVLYTGEYYGEMSCAPKNTDVVMALFDPDGNEVERKSLKTNDFGSASADFSIPSDIKGGTVQLRLLYDSGTLACTDARVDDFVLPDFECEFESIDGLYFAGDSVAVRGCIKSYTGHKLGVTRASYRMSAFDGTEKMRINPDGTFEIKVPTPKNRWWGTSVTVSVRSASGETLEFTKYIPAGSYLDFRASLENETFADVKSDAQYGYVANTGNGDICNAVLSDSLAVFKLETFNSDNLQQALDVEYSVFLGDSLVSEGSARTPDKLRLPVPCRSGEFSVVFKASAADRNAGLITKIIRYNVICVQSASTILDADVDHIVIPRDGEGIAFDFGGCRGDIWAVAALYGLNCKLLYSGIVHLPGVRGCDGSMTEVRLPYDSSYPDAVQLSLFYFKYGKLVRWTHGYSRPVPPQKKMELSWSRFTDNALPGSEYSLSLKTNLPSEALVAIFDKSTETLSDNYWGEVFTPVKSASSPYLSYSCGRLGYDAGKVRIRGYALTKAAGLMNSAAEEAVPFQLAETAPAFDTASAAPDGGLDIPVRSDFSTTLCWKPLLRTNSSGELSFKFRTSDKTGTFIVNAFAHDREMHNKALRREMTVSLPLEISVAQPVILYPGDSFSLNALVSTREKVDGDLTLYAGSGGTSSRAVSVAADTVIAVSYPLTVPALADTLSLRLVFRDREGKFSDALAFSIPVGSPLQTLTEAHSAVCRKASQKDGIVSSLRSQFVNTPSIGAEYREIKILDMVCDALKPRRTINGRAVTDVSDAIGVNLLYGHITGEDTDISAMLETLSDYRNEDGGYAWMEDMLSSPAITAALLERNARVAAVTGMAFLSDSLSSSAVHYLDRMLFSEDNGYRKYLPWRQGLSLDQYMYVRSFYAGVPFEEQPDAEAREDFCGEVSARLFPKDIRGLSANVFAKVLRLCTLDNLYSSPEGETLLRSWGVVPGKTGAVLRSLLADVESLEEYTVRHPSGGVYCPNLVMPYRGLLSSEAYCHSILADVIGRYSPKTGDGICLWLMLQKETQKWENNFEFTSAVASVLGASAELLETQVLVLSKSYEKPYSALEAAGNGFSISRQFCRTDADGGRIPVSTGDTLRAGDRIIAVYRIWSGENRSYVRMTVPHFGCMRPVKQLSGSFGWQRYREVRSDRTVYWMETCPEEITEITEEYFITQTGVFTAPVAEIESLYAPHYRANGAYEGSLDVVQ